MRQIRSLERVTPASAEDRCALGMLYLRVGQLERADSTLRALVRERPRQVDARLALASVDRSRLDFAAADEQLAVAVRLAPRSIPVRLARADAALERADLAHAAVLYAAVLRVEPGSSPAALGLARVAYARNQLDSARRRLDALLGREPALTAALLLRATIHHSQQQLPKWKADAAAALASDSLSPAAHLAWAGVVRDAGQVDAAYREAVAALALDPYDEGAHSYIGNGGSITSYGRYPPLADDSVPPSLGRTLAAADSALARRSFGRAERLYRAALMAHPMSAAAMLGIGAVHYRRGQYRTALDWYLRTAQAYPDLGIAHYGAATAMKALRDQRNPEVQAARRRFRAMPRPAEPERLRDVFPDYDRLDADLQKVILLAVAPVRHYIPLLATAGATFRLIPFERRMWEMPDKERTRGTRTFDLRLWDDVKGQGGFHALSGEEWVRDAMNGRYNVLSHEFMHQVHGTVLTDEQRAEITRLFATAKRERRTLDSYADFNEMEYFAQAYEAAISETKLSDQKGTSGHTRAELERLDPDVHRFIITLARRPATDANAVIATTQRIGALIGDGKLAAAVDTARQALARYGDRAELLTQLGRAQRLSGDYVAASAADERAIAAFPRVMGGYAGLADDYVYAARDYPRAVATLERAVAANPESGEGWMRLAGIALAAGRLEVAQPAVARADSLIPAPNPYAAYSTPGAVAARAAFLASQDTIAERLYRFSIEHVTRADIGAWTGLATIALRRGDTATARTALEAAQAVDRQDARVREIEADLLAAAGERRQARERLLLALDRDSTRLETITALVANARVDDPAGAAAYVERGMRVVADTSPVRFSFERGRFRSRDVPTMPAIARFQREAALVSLASHDTAAAIARHLAAVRAFPLDFPSVVALIQLYAARGSCSDAAAWRHRLDTLQAPPRYRDAVRPIATTGDAAVPRPCP
ncbi:MAG TPA: tetratricopeptide repeat protein [Gemmatimonadaceae bacterium]|nr:tetratricopeptide repeat protein [Gemmatimonadaceae bacterium]